MLSEAEGRLLAHVTLERSVLESAAAAGWKAAGSDEGADVPEVIRRAMRLGALDVRLGEAEALLSTVWGLQSSTRR